jgi:hypothetical protein
MKMEKELVDFAQRKERLLPKEDPIDFTYRKERVCSKCGGDLFYIEFFVINNKILLH